MAENTNEQVGQDRELYDLKFEILKAQHQAAIADQRISAHEQQCIERYDDIKRDMEKIDRNISTMSGRWFTLSASGITILLAIIGYLLTNDVDLSKLILDQNPAQLEQNQVDP